MPPSSQYIYLCDGYGSNNIYPFDRYTGAWTHRTYGGKGGTAWSLQGTLVAPPWSLHPDPYTMVTTR